jgi:hypothetical protein
VFNNAGIFRKSAGSGTTTFNGNITFTLTAQSILAHMPVTIQSPQVVSNLFRFSVQTVSNQNYTLPYNLNLAATNWVPLLYFIGDGSLRQIAATLATAQRFFRVSLP